jgi:hypothetical protein
MILFLKKATEEYVFQVLHVHRYVFDLMTINAVLLFILHRITFNISELLWFYYQIKAVDSLGAYKVNKIDYRIYVVMQLLFVGHSILVYFLGKKFPPLPFKLHAILILVFLVVTLRLAFQVKDILSKCFKVTFSDLAILFFPTIYLQIKINRIVKSIQTELHFADFALWCNYRRLVTKNLPYQ